MLSVNHLDIRFGEKHLFKDVSVQVYEGNRIGLVGVNGAGKSTLLKIMAGLNATDDGVLSKAKNFTVGYLPQESTELLDGRTLYAEAQTAFAGLLALQEEAILLHDKLTTTAQESPEFQALLQRQGEVQHLLDGSDIYTMQAKIEKVLLGLGFRLSDMEQPVSIFSGGWLMRLKLAKMLLEAPSLLLLDEPTNHLDLESLTWVEEFLRQYKGAMVIISHDRTFLDKVTTATWEISLGRISTYKGNYSFYLQDKEERRSIERSAYDNQQARIRQTMRFVERFRAKSTKAKQVQSRVKQLEKMDVIELGEEERQIRFNFPPAPPSGRDVMVVENLQKSYNGKQVLANVNLQLQRGDKVAVVGVNGAGKSTLVKILAGQIDCDEGTIRLGANVILSYFGQHQAQELPGDLTILDTVYHTAVDMTITQVRSLLGAFLFTGDEVEKKVQILSGGEKSRVALAKMLVRPANLMLLDEPTNHLDMSSQEILQEAMAQYEGTIIVVSHNRFFVNSFINKVLEIRNGKAAIFEGNIDDYLERRRQEEAGSESKTVKNQPGKGKPEGGDEEQSVDRKVQRQQRALDRQALNRKLGPWKKKSEEAEQDIEKQERRKAELVALMADPDLYSDQERWTATSKEYGLVERSLERAYQKWEEAQQAMEALEKEL